MTKFLMMVGLVGSGKSTKAQELSKEYDATIFSSDALREERFGDVNHQADNTKLFNELHRRIKECLKNGKNAIYDATNISYKRRMAFLQDLKHIPCEKVCILMATPYEECLRRNAERERQVPEYVIEKMYRQFDVPWLFEGWDLIEVEYDTYEKSFGLPQDWVESVLEFDQHNTHHSLTLGEHCNQVWKNVTKLAFEDKTVIMQTALRYAALIHDNGKVFCKTFLNTRGEVTEQAHYYSHEHTGSYDSLFFEMPCYQLYVATLIRWHMQPYYWEKDNNDSPRS